MERATETDKFGNVTTFDLPEVKKCPVCRIEVSQEYIDYIKSTVEGNN